MIIQWYINVTRRKDKVDIKDFLIHGHKEIDYHSRLVIRYLENYLLPHG